MKPVMLVVFLISISTLAEDKTVVIGRLIPPTRNERSFVTGAAVGGFQRIDMEARAVRINPTNVHKMSWCNGNSNIKRRMQ